MEAPDEATSELRFKEDTADLPLVADGLLQTIENRSVQEGRNATEVLLDLLREATQTPTNGNGGMS
jgi:hypothetical protein